VDGERASDGNRCGLRSGRCSEGEPPEAGDVALAVALASVGTASGRCCDRSKPLLLPRSSGFSADRRPRSKGVTADSTEAEVPLGLAEGAVCSRLAGECTGSILGSDLLPGLTDVSAGRDDSPTVELGDALGDE
jgi:hypothetical protein